MREFTLALDNYRAAWMQAEEQAVASGDPFGVDALAQEMRSPQEHAMLGAMDQLDQISAQIVALLDEVKQTETDIVSEYGEGSKEHEELRNRWQEYRRIGEDLATCIRKAHSSYDAREQR